MASLHLDIDFIIYISVTPDHYESLVHAVNGKDGKPLWKQMKLIHLLVSINMKEELINCLIDCWRVLFSCCNITHTCHFVESHINGLAFPRQ